jgi:hypothetical protein
MKDAMFAQIYARPVDLIDVRFLKILHSAIQMEPVARAKKDTIS